MNIVSTISTALFVKGVVAADETLENGKPHIAIIGRSNVGKSSLINSLTHQRGLAITSSSPGRTQQINVFLVNKAFYFLDLPGYGFAKASKEDREKIQKLIGWYLFESGYQQKMVVLIIDANVGLTAADLEMIDMLEEEGKNIVIVANKIDRLRSSEIARVIQKITDTVEVHKVVPYSSKSKIGLKELAKILLN